ncbi:LysR family transcriptional regulator [Lysinibacillus fusiformis]|uniref:DNA-binding transcriptional regulator, LysR family n=1 Tax=Lysinibacillus fusiformis TaxID=28031 RepID=A0A1H9SXV5_9BACI|nr:LysR family transcriptional regulator [Lysinibacillus fusiformis]SCY86083.1 DNA-binding transcriptional regulator, LysR family [Lysinibacillus fusiformis]SEO61773.1 DNA-binding transcriptional regulator, LysR family [Lysinibacillus fusiformis]SER89279.1 DNA-binding transcriptional regulator, LysR family [Lysinibacillus fusiformis]
MSLVKYEIFSKAAELNSFTKTAEKLGLTQSAVSHAITSLEKEFNFPLFIRNNSAIKLTQNGMNLLVTIREILYYNDILKQEVNAINGLNKGTVKVGVFSSISTKWIPFIMKEMEKKYPNIEIKLIEGNYAEIEKWLLDNEVDCGFINNSTSSLRSFDIVKLKTEPLLCVVSEQSPLHNNKHLSVEDIETTPFIMPTYQCFDDIQLFFKENNIKPNIRFENMNENSIFSMVENNLGISILPEMIIPKGLNSIKVIPLELEQTRTIGLAIRTPISPAVKKFSEVTENWVKKLSYS